MFDKLENLFQRKDKIMQLISDPLVIADQKYFKSLNMELKEIEPILDLYTRYKTIKKDLLEYENILVSESDRELREMAEGEIDNQRTQVEELETELKYALVPRDPEDFKNAIVEIRAGTGGDEAGLFAADLYRMYVRYAEEQGWKIDIISSNYTGIDGLKEIIFSVSGEEVYGTLKFESGVHRVQRVPKTEASGRIHTSAATVAVLPEIEDIDFEVNPNEVRVDVFRSSGAGGQAVNKLETAVRLTHLPSGMIVTCQDEKSQSKNKEKAWKVLRSRLYEKALIEHESKIAADRKSKVSTGDRSAKIRTYNFPQGRVTDHRINKTLHSLPAFMDGELAEMLDALKFTERTEKLNNQLRQDAW